MTRPATVQIRTYRGHRLEVCDDGGDGWIIAIYPLHGGVLPEVLRNSVPNGLGGLLAEAQRRVDRRLDGAPDEALRGF